jgi:protein TonB
MVAGDPREQQPEEEAMTPKTPSTPPSNRHTVVATSTMENLFLEAEDDDKVLKKMLFAAGLAHLLLLAWQLPKVDAIEVAPPERHVVAVVQTPRFVEPTPPREPPPVEQIVRQVQIPDPTPDDPEPLREWTEVEPRALDLPPSDILWDLPTAPPEMESSVPIHVSGNVVAPVKLHAPAPEYPEPARRVRLQGVAIVQAILDTDGRVTSVRVLRSPGMGMGEAAAEAIRGWLFEPARLNGRAVAVYYTLTVNFSLEGS